MTAAEIVAVRLELGRSMRAKEDTLAQRLLAKIEAGNRLAEAPDLVCFDEFCACGNPLLPGDLASCEACRRGRK